MALQQMIDNKKYIFVYLVNFVQFLPGTNFHDKPSAFNLLIVVITEICLNIQLFC